MRFKKAYDEFGDTLYKGWLDLPKSSKSLSVLFTIGYMSTISHFPYCSVALYLIVYFELLALLLAAVRYKDNFIMKSADRLETLPFVKWLIAQKRGVR